MVTSIYGMLKLIYGVVISRYGVVLSISHHTHVMVSIYGMETHSLIMLISFLV